LTTTYNSGGCSASHAATRDDCLTTASDSDWSICMQTLSRLLTWSEWPVYRVSKYSLRMDPNRKRRCSVDVGDISRVPFLCFPVGS
jgi:hypothetical protein